MALQILHSKTLECSVYRHPCFLVYGKIYNQLCFLSFSMPCFPTLEINLLDEAVSNQFLRSTKKYVQPYIFFFAEQQEAFFFFYARSSSLKKKKKTTKTLMSDLSHEHSSVGVDCCICLWVWRLWRSSTSTFTPKAESAGAHCSRLSPVVLECPHGW